MEKKRRRAKAVNGGIWREATQLPSLSTQATSYPQAPCGADLSKG